MGFQRHARGPAGSMETVDCSPSLMLWARITFGRRSFHLAANTTEGELVTTGPFRYVRNPIYCAVCLFTWTGAFAHFSWPSMAFAALVLLSALARIYSEETFLKARYPGYANYAART